MSLNLVIETGSYTGNGTSQSITIGWQPALVIILSTDSAQAAARAKSFKTSDMSQDNTIYCARETFYDIDGITLTSTGFSVGSDVRCNKNTVTFYWMAIRAGAHVDLGTFVGDAAPTKTVTTNRQPDAVLLFKITEDVNDEELFWKFSSMSGAYAVEFTSATSYSDSRITLQSTGFLLGSACKITGETYVWIALYSVEGTQHCESGSYVGNGTTQAITLGYQPSYVIICDENGDGVCTKFDNLPTTDAGHLDTQYDYESGVVAITSTGFTLPLGSIANQNNVDYNYLAGRY